MSLSSSAAHALIGNGARLRRQVSYWAITLGLYAVCLLLLAVEGAAGLAGSRPVAWLVAAIVTGALLFYLPVRSSERLGLSPSLLAMAQAVFAIACIVAAYAVIGPARGCCWWCWCSAPSRCRRAKRMR